MKTAIENVVKETTRNYEVIPVKNINIDFTYQRPLRDTHRKIATSFDPNRLGTIIVSNRGTKDKPVYYVIDGQHRLEAFKLLEFPTIPALVITGLSVEDEMKIFVKQDEHRARISGSDIYNAGKHLKGSLDNRLYLICKKTGVHCIDSMIKADIVGPRAFAAYKKAIKLHGDEVVEKVFKIYSMGKHKLDPAFYNRYLFDALLTLTTDKALSFEKIVATVNSFDNVGEIYSKANQANAYVYTNAVDIANVLRNRMKTIN